MANFQTNNFCGPHMLAYALVIIGAINWGLIGIGSFFSMNLNLVGLIFGGWPSIENMIYVLVGICAVFMLFQGYCRSCQENK